MTLKILLYKFGFLNKHMGLTIFHLKTKCKHHAFCNTVRSICIKITLSLHSRTCCFFFNDVTIFYFYHPTDYTCAGKNRDSWEEDLTGKVILKIQRCLSLCMFQTSWFFPGLRIPLSSSSCYFLRLGVEAGELDSEGTFPSNVPLYSF